MKNLLPLALLTPTAALAHPWGHERMTLASLLDHAASNPDHTALILAALGFVGYRLWVRK